MKSSNLKIITIIAILLYFLSLDNHIYAQDGLRDITFNSGLGQSNTVNDIAVQSNGQILIGGQFPLYSGQWINNFARLNTNGVRDTSFHTGTGPSGNVYCIVIQSDGKILIGGGFYNYNGVARAGIARINTDGTLDTTFNPGTGMGSGWVNDIAIEAGGKIIIAGAFTTFNGTSRNRIARLNSDGSLDITFNPGTGADAIIRTIDIQSNGKIMVGGHFSTFNGVTRNYIARLNTNGSIDNTFNPGTGTSAWINKIVVQSDGKILIGGAFHFYDGYSSWYLVRANMDGSVDSSFFSGFDYPVMDILMQPNNKIVIVGAFTSGLGLPAHRIARVNIDGSKDVTYQTLSGADDDILAVAMQSDWKLIVGGEFDEFISSSGTAAIARVHNAIVTSSENSLSEYTLNAYPNPVYDYLTINHTGNEIGEDYTLFDYTGRSILTGRIKLMESVINLSGLPAGIYFYKLNSRNQSLKILKAF